MVAVRPALGDRAHASGGGTGISAGDGAEGITGCRTGDRSCSAVDAVEGNRAAAGITRRLQSAPEARVRGAETRPLIAESFSSRTSRPFFAYFAVQCCKAFARRAPGVLTEISKKRNQKADR